MNRWRILFLSAFLLSAAGVIYLAFRIGKFAVIQKLTGKSWWKRFLAGLLCVSIAGLILYLTIGIVNLIICLLHVTAIWLIADITALAVRLVRKKKSKYYIAGAAALVFSAGWLCYGWYNAHHVVGTKYVVQTDKDLAGDPLRIVMFADSHIGATFHAEKFEKLVKDMEAQDPDVLVILGDYVDDDTSKEDMEECCAVLGRAKIRGGIYYVYGNHDRGYYSMERRGYGGAELAAELEKNGVIILRDETVLIQDRFYLTGREDASNRSRKSMEELLKDLDKRYFTVILDHQPHDFETQEKSGVDLVLCGHTHGGWLFPFNKIPEMSGTDDKSYGREKRSGTEFIVSSGISEWALKFKTGCPSEYVIIDVEGKKE